MHVTLMHVTQRTKELDSSRLKETVFIAIIRVPERPVFFSPLLKASFKKFTLRFIKREIVVSTLS